VLPLDAMEETVDHFGLNRCGQCNELRGLARTENGFVPVSCLCEGIVCRSCRQRAIRRPISNYIDEQTGQIWHVPWFGYLIPCPECRKKNDPAPRLFN
jgi:hypothetical protein